MISNTLNLSRRTFLQGSTLLGLSAAAGTFALPAMAEEPVRGGTLRMGLEGGASAAFRQIELEETGHLMKLNEMIRALSGQTEGGAEE